ncbi:hypothetical protein OHS18_41250 [Amycolatopsis sp. NBC_00355]|uniref:hypothetical protein n=1 Tax=Amycolatopsis sp. NBC_00355 TaxID=2975957 RepID=UPI002E27602E
MALGREDRSEEFLEHARRAYGDLRNPYYGFFADAQENNPWKSLLRGFGEFLDVEEWTDRTDDVSFSYVLSPHRRSRSGWLLWLSAVGPYAFLAYGDDPDTPLARDDVVTDFGEDRPAEEKRIIELLRNAGLTLLSAEEIEMTVDFHPPDGSFPVSAFVMLFSESDVPWWHEG